MAHVKKTMRANKGLSLKKVLQKAAASYKKTKKAKRGGGASSAAPGAGSALPIGQTGSSRRGRGSRKTRSRKH